jgi:hypothetical protein
MNGTSLEISENVAIQWSHTSFQNMLAETEQKLKTSTVLQRISAKHYPHLYHIQVNL